MPATGWGVKNYVQAPKSFLPRSNEGHVVWMSEFRQDEAISTILVIAAASVAGWKAKTGMFHFLVALALLSRIDYEAMALNIVPLLDALLSPH